MISLTCCPLQLLKVPEHSFELEICDTIFPRKQKKQEDCKDMKWEGYLNTLAEVGCQNGIKNQTVEVDDYLFR